MEKEYIKCPSCKDTPGYKWEIYKGVMSVGLCPDCRGTGQVVKTFQDTQREEFYTGSNTGKSSGKGAGDA